MYPKFGGAKVCASKGLLCKVSKMLCVALSHTNGTIKRQVSAAKFGAKLLCAMAKLWRLLAWESVVGVSRVWVSSSVKEPIAIAKDEMRNPKESNFL
jgi:hypothetical protein